jgi:DNA-binding transcriptional ArsR family regulator
MITMANSIPSQNKTVSVRIALEPVLNALNSFSLLNATGRLIGLNAWVTQTAAVLTPEQRYANRLLFESFYDALTPEPHVTDFPTYLQALDGQDAFVLQNWVLEGLRARFARRIVSDRASSAPSAERLLSDVNAYLTCAEYVQADAPFDAALQVDAHALLNSPVEMQNLIVAHLTWLWEEMFAAEWRRVKRSLSWQVEMFTRSLDDEVTLGETFHAFTGRYLPPEANERLSDAQEITLVPSWHNGRYITFWQSETETRDTTRLFFSEPPNYDVAELRDKPIGRAELRARLSALADETRLRIIELLVQHDEMQAQEIIATLDLSQSSVSRHLKQLVSMGYLYERRGEGANKTYRLSTAFFDRTMRGLDSLLSGEIMSEHLSFARRDVRGFPATLVRVHPLIPGPESPHG